VFDSSFNGKKVSGHVAIYTKGKDYVTGYPKIDEFRGGGLYQNGRLILIQLLFSFFSAN